MAKWPAKLMPAKLMPAKKEEERYE